MEKWKYSREHGHSDATTQNYFYSLFFSISMVFLAQRDHEGFENGLKVCKTVVVQQKTTTHNKNNNKKKLYKWIWKKKSVAKLSLIEEIT